MILEDPALGKFAKVLEARTRLLTGTAGEVSGQEIITVYDDPRRPAAEAIVCTHIWASLADLKRA